MEPGPGSRLDALTLVDWRRMVGELYVEVRHLADSDPVAAHLLWRVEREALYREHPQSPVPSAQRATFRALHFPYDPALRFEVAVEPELNEEGAASAALLALPNSGTDVLAFRPVGSLAIPFGAGPRRLSLFWMEGYAGGLFLPFRDATNGGATYGAGRYLLDGAKGADLGGDTARGTLVLDFNFSYQPSCAFDPRWSCPLAPPENRLDLAVEAGERIA